MTLFELMRERSKRLLTKSLDRDKTLNPLGVLIGGYFSIDTFEERGILYRVEAINSGVETIGGQDFPVTVYVMADNDDNFRLLQVSPVERADAVLKYNCVLLQYTYEAGNDQAIVDGLIDAINDPAGEFTDFVEGETYTRRFRGYDGWIEPHKITYKHLRDLDGDGKVTEDETITYPVLQWDYELNDKFLFVEQNQNDGVVRIYSGSQVPQELITTI